MAIWQYDFSAVPRHAIAAVCGAVPAVLTLEQINKIETWKSSQPHKHFEADFNKWRPKLKSWAPDLQVWGDEESNRIDVVSQNGRVVEVEFRVELRAISNHFLEVLTNFARKSNCVLVSMHSLDVVDPLRQSVLLHLARSAGANRVLDLLNDSNESVSMTKRPQVFLSHSSLDKVFVGQLAADLKSNKIPVWFDQWELKVGDSLIEKIEDGINGSGWLAVVLSRNSAESAWVKKELKAAEMRELRDKKVFVLPIVIDNCEIPLFMADKVYADFRETYDVGFKYLLRRLQEGG